jgi:phage terminase Nu1 subunit (DNA packaging protein)
MLQVRSSSKDFASTQGELAALFGVSRVTIMDWVQRGAPRKTAKGWDVDAMRVWREQNMRPAQWTGGDSKLVSASDEARLLKAQADEREAKAALADLKLKIERGEYVPRSEVKDRDLARIAVVRRGLLGLPRTAAPRVVGLTEKEAEVALTTVVRDLLERFASL